MDEDTVMIGDYLGTIEEFLPGEGTYAQDGKIFAACIGKKVLNHEKHLAEVKGKSIPNIKVGDVVFGEVMNIRRSQVTVIVSKIKDIDTLIDERTSIYVSNIADSYVDSPDDMFAIGDIVKAEVLKMNNGLIDLSTKGDYGVVKAFCRRCRNPIVKSESKKGKMECPVCGHVEMRKAAADYGNVKDI